MTAEIDYMGQYASLNEQIAQLQDQAAAVRKLALAQAAARVREVMNEAGLTPADFGSLLGGRKVQDKSTRAPWGSKSRGGKPVVPGESSTAA